MITIIIQRNKLTHGGWRIGRNACLVGWATINTKAGKKYTKDYSEMHHKLVEKSKGDIDITGESDIRVKSYNRSLKKHLRYKREYRLPFEKAYKAAFEPHFKIIFVNNYEKYMQALAERPLRRIEIGLVQEEVLV